MSERRGVLRSLLFAAISIAAGAVIASVPALAQHPNHTPPPPPRPPAHPAPRREVRPPAQTQAPVPKPPVTESRVQVGSQPQGGAVVQGATPGGSMPAVGTRVYTVPHPPVRPWEQRNADIPESERPPPGMCRVWLDKVPASSQPAPTSCAKAIQMHPPNGHVIFGEDGRRPSATRVPPANTESAPAPPNETPF